MNETQIKILAYTKDGNCVINHIVACESTHEAVDACISYERKAAYMKARVVRIVFDIAYPTK